MNFKVVIKEDTEDRGYNMNCYALSVYHSHDDTIEEVLENIKETIIGCLEVLNERAKIFGYKEKILEITV